MAHMWAHQNCCEMTYMLHKWEATLARFKYGRILPWSHAYEWCFTLISSGLTNTTLDYAGKTCH
jgi:hypothetical protein